MCHKLGHSSVQHPSQIPPLLSYATTPRLRHVVKSHKIMNIFFFNSGTHLSFGNVYLSRKTRHYATAGCYVCVCVCVWLFSFDIFPQDLYFHNSDILTKKKKCVKKEEKKYKFIKTKSKSKWKFYLRKTCILLHFPPTFYSISCSLTHCSNVIL